MKERRHGCERRAATALSAASHIFIFFFLLVQFVFILNRPVCRARNWIHIKVIIWPLLAIRVGSTRHKCFFFWHTIRKINSIIHSLNGFELHGGIRKCWTGETCWRAESTEHWVHLWLNLAIAKNCSSTFEHSSTWALVYRMENGEPPLLVVIRCLSLLLAVPRLFVSTAWHFISWTKIKINSSAFLDVKLLHMWSPCKRP